MIAAEGACEERFPDGSARAGPSTARSVGLGADWNLSVHEKPLRNDQMRTTSFVSVIGPRLSERLSRAGREIACGYDHRRRPRSGSISEKVAYVARPPFAGPSEFEQELRLIGELDRDAPRTCRVDDDFAE